MKTFWQRKCFVRKQWIGEVYACLCKIMPIIWLSFDKWTPSYSSGLFKQAADAVYLHFLKSVDIHSVSTHNKHSFLHLDCCHKSFIEWLSGDFNITTCVQWPHFSFSSVLCSIIIDCLLQTRLNNNSFTSIFFFFFFDVKWSRRGEYFATLLQPFFSLNFFQFDENSRQWRQCISARDDWVDPIGCVRSK